MKIICLKLVCSVKKLLLDNIINLFDNEEVKYALSLELFSMLVSSLSYKAINFIARYLRILKLFNNF